MIIQLEVSEPWDLTAWLSPVIELAAEQKPKDDQSWPVRLCLGAANIKEAILSPRYEGQTLDELRSGRAQVVNLLIIYERNSEGREKEMLVGTARLIDQVRS